MNHFDLEKPLCIFILDLSDILDTPVNPETVIQEYVDTKGHQLSDECKQQDTPSVPQPAIIGSKMPFDGWENIGRACQISPVHYALATNQPMKEDSQYKWLDMAGSIGKDGSTDSNTGYCYEPRPFINRQVKFRVPVPGEELVIIVDRWGDYKSQITYTKLEKWMAQDKFESALLRLNGKQEKTEMESKYKNPKAKKEPASHNSITSHSKGSEHKNTETTGSPKTASNNKGDLDNMCSKDSKVHQNMQEITNINSNKSKRTEGKCSDKNPDHVDKPKVKLDAQTTDENENTLQYCGEEKVSHMDNADTSLQEAVHSPFNLVSIQEETIQEDGQNDESDKNKTTDQHTNKKEGNMDSKLQTSGPSANSSDKMGGRACVKEGVITKGCDKEASHGEKSKSAARKENISNGHIQINRAKDITPKVNGKKQTPKSTSVYDEPVRLRSNKGRQSNRPKSLDTNFFRMKNSPGFMTLPKSFTFCPEMKLSKFRRSTEEMFIETTPSRTYSRGWIRSGSHSSGSESESTGASPTLSHTVRISPRKDTEDSVFKDNKESPESDGPVTEKLSKVLLKDMFGDMMNRARKISSEFKRH